MSNWYIGQNILAVKDHTWGFIKKGAVYRIRGLRSGGCSCGKVEINIGVANPADAQTCKWCNFLTRNTDGFIWLCETNFAPIEEADLSELMEILNDKTERV